MFSAAPVLQGVVLDANNISKTVCDHIRPPAALGDRRRLVRASRLSRAAEEHPQKGPPARRRHPRFRQSAAAHIPGGKAARRLVAWDTLEAETYRHEAFPTYQSGREFDDDLLEQLTLIPDFVAACGFANARRAGYEADDFLAAAAAEERRGGTVLVASGDRDTFQLASANTTILYPVRAGEMARIGPAEVCARYGVEPKQVPDFIALRGDPSDKLPGAPGVGAAGAATLLRQYGSLAAILKAGRFAKQAANLRLYRAIATMDRKAPVPRLEDQKPTWAKAAALAREWELKQLAGRLEDLARNSAPS